MMGGGCKDYIELDHTTALPVMDKDIAISLSSFYQIKLEFCSMYVTKLPFQS